MSLTAEQLALVTSLPREEWGEGFEVMTRCAERADPELPIRPYFKHAMRLHRFDQLRRRSKASYETGRRVYTMRKTEMLPDTLATADTQVVETIKLSEDLEYLPLAVRGVTHKVIADLKGVCLSTVNNKIRREVSRLKARCLRRSLT